MNRSHALKMPFAIALISAVALAAPPQDTPSTGTGSPSNPDRTMRPGSGSSDTMRGSDSRGSTGSSTTSGTVDKTATGSEKIGKTDKDFVKNAADIGTAEVKISQLAVSKASNPQVKRFAQQMIDDHTKVNDELKTMVGRYQDVTLSDTLSSAGQKNYDKLSDISGDKFDREYINIMVDDHKKAINQFEKESKKADADEFKSFAARTLPALQHHLEQAQSLERDLKARM